jgi:hypothetical protein
MNTNRSGRSQAVALAAIVIIVPMLHLLSAPALSASVAFSATRGWLDDPQPDWLCYYEAPYHSAAESALLKWYLRNYALEKWRPPYGLRFIAPRTALFT